MLCAGQICLVELLVAPAVVECIAWVRTVKDGTPVSSLPTEEVNFSLNKERLSNTY